MAARDACVCALADVCRRVHLGVGMCTHPVTTQPLPERKVPEAWPCSMVGLVINRGAVQEGCRMINWAQDLICNVLMKMKRGWRVVPEWWWYVCMCYGGWKTVRYFNEAFICWYTACADGLVLVCVTTLSFSSPPPSLSNIKAQHWQNRRIQTSSLYQRRNHLTLPSTKLQFTVGLLIKFNLTLPEGNDIVL